MTVQYPHRIRLRGPWECEPLERTPPDDPPSPRRMTLPCRWADGGLAGFSGRARFVRRFGYPGRIDAWERVWLTVAGVSDRADLRLNGAGLGAAGGEPCEFEVAPLLRPRNELVMDVRGGPDGGPWGEVALEVRCTAFLRDVRVWREGDALHAAGRVVGEAERPLDLYLLLGGATAAYAAVKPAPAGAPFHIIAEKRPAAGEARVDLVNGAVIWYTAAQELAADRPS